MKSINLDIITYDFNKPSSVSFSLRSQSLTEIPKKLSGVTARVDDSKTLTFTLEKPNWYIFVSRYTFGKFQGNVLDHFCDYLISKVVIQKQRMICNCVK